MAEERDQPVTYRDTSDRDKNRRCVAAAGAAVACQGRSAHFNVHLNVSTGSPVLAN